MTDKNTVIGDLGEAVAARFLVEQGYSIEDTNFQRKSGELDIVAVKSEELVFVEVKSVRCKIPAELPREGSNNYRPEENVSHQKRQRLQRIIQIYLNQAVTNQIIWRCDLLCTYLDFERKIARIKWLKNIII